MIHLPIADSYNVFALGTSAAICALHTIIAIIIWIRIFQYYFLEPDVKYSGFDNVMFVLAGCAFTLSSIMHLFIILGRAEYISWELWAGARIVVDLGSMFIAIYAAYRITDEKYKVLIPSFLVLVSIVSGITFLYIYLGDFPWSTRF